jgi:trk system potassium uptake protein TrkH
MVGASVVLASLGRSMSLRDSLMLQDGAPTLSLAEATQLSKRILIFMLSFEAVGAVIFTLEFLQHRSPGVAIWHGVFTSISAFCNSGIDLEGDFRSISSFTNSWMFSITGFLLIQAGALSYVTFGDIWAKRRWRRFSLDTKLVLMTNAILLVGGSLMFLMLEWNNTLASIDTAFRPMVAFFQSASTRTAGFSAVSFGEAHPATVFLSIALMLVGGAAGSTTGGVKLATVAILFLAVMSTVRGQSDPQAFGRRVSIQQVFRAMALTALFLFAHFLLTLALAITEDVIGGKNFGFLPIMLESMSAVATAGLSTGITSDLSGPGKILLCVGMYLGRLGPLMAIYALQRRQQLPLYRYPESAVRIG